MRHRCAYCGSDDHTRISQCPKHDDDKFHSKKFDRLVGRKTVVIKAPVEVNHSLCVMCGGDVTPGMCHTGKVLDSFTWFYKEWVDKHGDPRQERVPVTQFAKGYICDGCAANSESVTDHRTGRVVQIVQTDSTLKHPGNQIEGTKSNKGFNTRITQ